FQAEDGIRDFHVTGVQTCALPIFKNISKITQIHCPVLVIHGKNDQVISFWHGEKLFQAANEPKLFYGVQGSGHNDLFEVAGNGRSEERRVGKGRRSRWRWKR